jgi:tetratricopeptide (TPR) repeat protein
LLWLPAAIGSGHRSWTYRDERLLWESDLALNPDSFQAQWGLGLCRRRYGDLLGALAPLERARQLRPRHYQMLTDYTEVLLRMLPEHATPPQALEVARHLNEVWPDDAWGRTLLVRAELAMGEAGHGREHFERAEARALSCLEVAPPKGYVWQLAAKARSGLGDRDGALRHLDTSIANGLATIGVRLDRAALLRDLGRLAEAQRELALAQQQEPLNPQVMQAIAQFAPAPR